MELRTTESSVSELTVLYERLRVSVSSDGVLPSLRMIEEQAEAEIVSNETKAAAAASVGLEEAKAAALKEEEERVKRAQLTKEENEEDETTSGGKSAPPPTPKFASLSSIFDLSEVKANPRKPRPEPTAFECSEIEMASKIRFLQSEMISLKPKASKFQKRLTEYDPITFAPRYGAATRGRVRNMVASYNALLICMNSRSLDIPDVPIIQRVLERLDNNLDEQRARREKAEEEARQKQLEAERKAKMEREREEKEEAANKEEARRKEAEVQAALRQRADELRAQREAARAADAAWLAAIERSESGVRVELKKLFESTSEDLVARKTAVTSLHTILQQICAHPEDEKLRRIRRTHTGFHQDIGRHKGGCEVLIAAGFKPLIIVNEQDEDVPCLISHEPNIETEMDAWSNWFDLNKAALGVLGEAVERV